jgi:uncharacterized protein (TIGR03118 family)
MFMTPALSLALAMAAYGQTPANVYRVVNLVSNVSGTAAVTDPNLVDPWGMSASAGSPFWVSNHVAGNSTLYNGAGAITAVVVTIPSAAGGTVTGKPTGQVQNSAGAAFKVTSGSNASFIFASEDGLITAWQSGTVAEKKVDNSASKAVYKGLAIGTSAAGGTLYAANFRSGKIDVFGPGFTPISLAGSFADPTVPSGYAPFNIWNIGGSLFVEYAKQDVNQTLDVAGAGNGYVAVFDLDGNLLRHLVSNGTLNSPWGVAIAPASWGAFGGALLVGNFGDGRINAFNVTTGAYLGTLQDSTGAPIVIPGLWALLYGGNGARSDANTLYFVAGMPNGSTTPRGLLGSIAPPSAVAAVVNAASLQPGPIAAGELISISGQTVGAIPQVATTIPLTGGIGTTAGGTTVTINGVPAPILFTSGSFTNVQVPNILFAFATTASIVVQTPGQTTASFVVPMAQTAPGLFAANQGGTGALAALNQDGTVNTTTNGAAGGSTVTIFATGEGATNPPGLDGAIQTSPARAPFAQVSLKIGGQAATIVSAGTPVGRISGVMEIKAVVPSGLTPGPVPVVLTVGTVTTTQSVTLVVR